jgi:hypothetical protein
MATNDSGDANEGEGSRTADKQYREAATEYAKKADVQKAGRQAEDDVKRDPKEYERAVQTGKSKSKGDLDSDLGKK